jgi:DNA (cytosine-5)-methyltransferase 1
MAATHLRVADLFSGCGGLSIGFDMQGIDTVVAMDHWRHAVDTYNHNAARGLVSGESVQHDLSDVESTVGLVRQYGPVDGIIGGPPCQDFSTAGKKQEGDRASLTAAYAKIVAEVQPKFFVMENVARSLTSNAYKQAVEILEAAGYFVGAAVVDASKVGAPQRRKRAFTVGTKDESATARIIESLTSGQTHDEVSVGEYISSVTGQAMDTDHYYLIPTNYKRRGIFSTSEPAPTMRGINRPIPPSYKGHPSNSADASKARPLTTKERSLVQTFPLDYEFVSSKTANEQMIGNAVPPLLASYVAQAVKSEMLD